MFTVALRTYTYISCCRCISDTGHVQVRVVNDVEDNFTELTKEFSDLKNSCLPTCHQVMLTTHCVTCQHQPAVVGRIADCNIIQKCSFRQLLNAEAAARFYAVLSKCSELCDVHVVVTVLSHTPRTFIVALKCLSQTFHQCGRS